MNPKKPKDFIKPTADELNIKDSLVDDVTSFYWKAVRKALSSLNEPSITVANFGTFKIRYTKIDKIKTKYENYIKSLQFNEMSFNQHTIKNISEEKIQKLEILKDSIDKERERRLQIINKRKEYVTNKNMEK